MCIVTTTGQDGGSCGSYDSQGSQNCSSKTCEFFLSAWTSEFRLSDPLLQSIVPNMAWLVTELTSPEDKELRKDDMLSQ